MGRGATPWTVGTVKAIVVLLLAGALAPAASAAAPVSVRATFDPPTVHFGDAIGMHVVVQVDPDRVDPGSVRVAADPGPLTPLTPTRTTRTGSVVEVDRTASCISDPCVATKGDATPKLPPVVVTAATRDGGTVRVSTAWPALTVQGRVTAADVARYRPPFRADTATPAPSYSVAPSTLAWLLDGAAIALALAAVALAVQLVRLLVRTRRAAMPVDQLARALRLAREAESRPTPDKRRALGLLSRVLGPRPLASTASDLAWSKPPPERESLTELVGDVEREVVT